MTIRNSNPEAGRSPFGELLLDFRTRRGLTQERLAQASRGGRISPRSITNYERSARNPQEWVLPHRPVLRLLADALGLDMVDRHLLVTAWNKSRTERDASSAETDEASDFVVEGREACVRSIMDAWGKARQGSPQMVFVGGVAGIGKTALARHISDSIAAAEKQVMISWGGASNWTSEIEPYLSIRSATDRIIQPPDLSGALPGRYTSRPDLGPGNVERVIESIPLLAGALISERALRDMAEGDDTILARVEEQIAARASTETIGRLEEYSQLLVHLSQSWPVVIILEDLHWAGYQTATLLTYLGRRIQGIQNAPILVVGTYRDDEVDSLEGSDIQPVARALESIGHLPNVNILTLNDAMLPAAGMAYVRGIIDKTPMANAENAEQLAKWIYDQASGHPFLTTGLMQHLVETGTLSRNDSSQWTFHPDNLPEQFPDAISSFIEQRLNRVDRRAKRILEVASAMENEIRTEIIADILETDVEETQDVIERYLVEASQLLLPGTVSTIPELSELSYRFPHALFREHIYSRMPRARKRRLHLAIAEAMDQQYSDPDSRVLAAMTSHYVSAQEWHNAKMAAFRLAQQSVLRFDWDLAEVWFPQAEQLAIKAQDPTQLWRTRAARLAMLRGTARHKEAIELGEHMLKLADIHNWPYTQALTYHHLGEIYYDLGMVEKSVDYLRKAIDLHLAGNSLDLAAAGYAMLSHSAYRQGRYDSARQLAQSAIDLSRELKNSWVYPEAVLAAANCDIDLGYFEEAIRNYQLSNELAIMIGRLNSVFIPPLNIALSHTYMGNYQTSIDILSDLLNRKEFDSPKRLNAPARLYMGYALEGSGQFAEAAANYAEAAQLRRLDIPHPPMFDAVAGQLRMAIAQDDRKSAREHMEAIDDHLDEHGWEGIEDPLLVMRSVADAHRYFGNDDRYRAYIERAFALLMDRAGMIESDVARESYFTRVPINVEIQKRHTELTKSK